MSAVDPTPAEHGDDWSGSLPGEEPSCRCGYNGTPDECAASRRPAVPDTGDVEALAVALCDADESWEHHDASDDHPCLRCKALAVRMLPYVAEREQAARDAALAPIEALLALYMSWQGEPDHPGSSSRKQREQLRAAIRDARGGAR